MSEITIGSHLTTPRIGYSHHGIYIGNQHVIHLTNNNRIEIVSLDKFTDGNGYSNHKFNSPYSRQEIIKRARSKLGSHDYSVIFNNCEHFVNWCVHDNPTSKQVNQAAIGLGSTSVLGIATRELVKQTATKATQSSVANLLASAPTGFTLLSPTPIATAAIMGFGVYKLVQRFKQ